MALISKDNEQNAAACEVTYPNERVLRDHHYSKMFISCPSIQQSVELPVFDSVGQPVGPPIVVNGIWKELKIDKSTKINIE